MRPLKGARAKTERKHSLRTSLQAGNNLQSLHPSIRRLGAPAAAAAAASTTAGSSPRREPPDAAQPRRPAATAAPARRLPAGQLGLGEYSHHSLSMPHLFDRLLLKT